MLLCTVFFLVISGRAVERVYYSLLMQIKWGKSHFHIIINVELD